MAVGKVHIDDTDTDFQILVQETNVSGTNIVFDLGDASTLQIVFTDPDGVETTVTGTILNSPGTDGLLRYVNSSPSPTINQTGLWQYRGKITVTSGGSFQTNNATFEVIR